MLESLIIFHDHKGLSVRRSGSGSGIGAVGLYRLQSLTAEAYLASRYVAEWDRFPARRRGGATACFSVKSPNQPERAP
jgi:hypothetical protein